MNNPRIAFRVHAVQRMFERNISAKSVARTLQSGEIIEDYSSEMPQQSQLVLGFQGKRPFHMVTSQNPEMNAVTVVTVYIPDPNRWNKTFKSRRP